MLEPSEAIAAEYAHEGVHCTVSAPGATATEIFDGPGITALATGHPLPAGGLPEQHEPPTSVRLRGARGIVGRRPQRSVRDQRPVDASIDVTRSSSFVTRFFESKAVRDTLSA